MKISRFAALSASAAVAFAVLLGTVGVAEGREPIRGPERPLVFVPGMLGSMLCRTGADGEETVIWGTVDAMGQFPTLAVDPARNDVEPCGLIREISFLGVFSQTVYGPFIVRLEEAGYRDGETLFVFDYDWRLSVLENAKRLAAFVEETIPGDTQIDIVGHSMGGLVARTYALNENGAPRIAGLISAGSPWRGSVQVFELLKSGWGLGTFFLGGIDSFRHTVISFPSMFEMMPHYDGCCGDVDDPAAFEAANADAWTALNWPGIDEDGLPDLAEAAGRQARLRAILEQLLPPTIEEAFVIGVDQRTPQQFGLEAGNGEAQLSVRTSWEGDGTVMRDSALLAQQRVIYPTSFATHDALLNDTLVQDFVLAALVNGPDVAIDIVPVRERTDILTVFGELVELVGVAIATDQPIYATGSAATATVHLRVGVEEPVDTSVITMTVAPPGGTATQVTLTPDPAAADPTNPFEQSFTARFATGDRAGELAVTVTLDVGTAAPRVVTRVVPVFAP